MVESGEHSRFSAEPCDAITTKREDLRQDLQRDIEIELGDLAHAPSPSRDTTSYAPR
jgi:hypothetical protein